MSTVSESPWTFLLECEGLQSYLPNVNCYPSILGNKKCLLKYKKLWEKTYIKIKIKFARKKWLNFAH